jgi:hypothetical protein
LQPEWSVSLPARITFLSVFFLFLHLSMLSSFIFVSVFCHFFPKLGAHHRVSPSTKLKVVRGMGGTAGTEQQIWAWLIVGKQYGKIFPENNEFFIFVTWKLIRESSFARWNVEFCQPDQGCQITYFQTKEHNLGKFGRVLYC